MSEHEYKYILYSVFSKRKRDNVWTTRNEIRKCKIVHISYGGLAYIQVYNNKNQRLKRQMVINKDNLFDTEAELKLSIALNGLLLSEVES